MKRGSIPWLVSAVLLLGATAATAQPLPCTSVSPEAREYVRSRGACRDIKPVTRPRKSTQSKSGAPGSPASAQQNSPVPDVLGRSYADAARALAEFKVERIETASAAPAGEVLAQEPAAAALGRPGSTVVLQVSDGSLTGAASTDPVTAPATAAEAASASAPDTTAAHLPPQEPINPVAAPATAATASSAPAPATSLALASTPVPLPPQEPIDPPVARGPFPAAFSAIAALIFVAGVSLGLLSGALLMRQWLLRSRLAAGEGALTPTPTLPRRLHPVDQQLVDQRPVDQRSVDEHPFDQLLVEQQLVDQQGVDQPPAEPDADVLPATSASPEIQFAAWLVPVATTIVLAPRRATDGIHTSIRATNRYERVRLLAPIEVSGASIETALFEQSKDESAVARVFEQLRDAAAERAADQLTRALDVDILDVLAQGWVQAPAMHGAVQLSAVTRGPPVLVKFDVPHSITSSSHLVLETSVAGSSLPPLELALEIVAEVQSATLAARDGRIELVALGEATVLARLKYKGALLKELSTEISGTRCDPSEPRPTATERPASVDFPL